MTLIIIALLSTYIISSDLAFMGLSRLINREKQVVPPLELFSLTRGIGPIMISWLMYNLFLFSPQQPPGYYIALIVGFCAVLLVWSRHQAPLLFEAYAAFWQSLRRLASLRSLSLILLICTLLSVLFIFIIGIAFPIVGHDSLVFATEAKIMRQDMSLEHFLARVEPDARTGFLPVSFQPPFLPMLYVWFSLIAGIGQMDILARTVSPVFGLYCLMLVGYLVRRHASLPAALWSIFLLAVTPLFLWMGYDNAQDTPRYYFLMLALYWFAKLLDAQTNIPSRMTLVVGLFAGFAVYSHLLGAPAVAAGILALLFLRRWNWRERLVRATAIVLTVILVGAGYHYLASAPLRAKFFGTISLDRPISEWTALAKSIVVQTDGQEGTDEARQAIFERRGHGGAPLRQFLLGRLQMFTGIEYFGFLFFCFWLAVFAWLRKSSKKTTFDKLLVLAAVIYCVVVLSGVRTNSWSNPRYVGSLLLIGAYFSGSLLARCSESAAQRPRWSRRIALICLILFLSFPALLVTTIRGAKVGITNKGNFYTHFRSLLWVEAFMEEPGKALNSFWQEYVGIRKTIRYAWASDEEKLKHSHDYLAAVLYFNLHAPADARALVFRDGRYFYYAKRYGIPFYDSRLRREEPPGNVEEVLRRFASSGITHILTDKLLERLPQYDYFQLGDLLPDPEISELIYEFGGARVYRLKALDDKKNTAVSPKPSNAYPIESNHGFCGVVEFLPSVFSRPRISHSVRKSRTSVHRVIKL
jgi:4-amino-4-deoxy-L-arabinose transferase-like glycosyltransferase